MNTTQRATMVLIAWLAGLHLSLAAPYATPEEQITTFLWGASGSAGEKAELIYNVVEDSYNTRITFTHDKKFAGSDGMHGVWSIDGGKLILTTLDTKDGFTIKLDPATLNNGQIKGLVTSKGKWHGRHIILKASQK